MHSIPWGVILAGGDGRRLKSLSRLISGDNRPKQFCELLGHGSLLAETRARLAPAIPPDRTLFVVVREHEKYFRDELARVDESRIVIQPANRGTTAAIAYSLLRLLRFDDDPLVAFFPADHYYADTARFTEALAGALDAVQANPGMLVLLGATANCPRQDYGWIEQAERLENPGSCEHPVFRVNRFCEKPDAVAADDLLRRGCLWNTFVIAGRARAFLDAVEAATPDVLAAMRPLSAEMPDREEALCAARLYEALPARDFSHEVLTACPERLAVLRMPDAGWVDLGTPEGLMTAFRHEPDSLAGAAPFTAWLLRYSEHLEEVRRAATAAAGK